MALLWFAMVLLCFWYGFWYGFVFVFVWLFYAFAMVSVWLCDGFGMILIKFWFCLLWFCYSFSLSFEPNMYVHLALNMVGGGWGVYIFQICQNISSARFVLFTRNYEPSEFRPVEVGQDVKLMATFVSE